MKQKHRVIQWNGNDIEDVPFDEIPKDWRNVTPAKPEPRFKPDYTLKSTEKIDQVQAGLLLFTMSSVVSVFSGLALVAALAVLYAIL